MMMFYQPIRASNVAAHPTPLATVDSDVTGGSQENAVHPNASGSPVRARTTGGAARSNVAAGETSGRPLSKTGPRARGRGGSGSEAGTRGRGSAGRGRGGKTGHDASYG
eukprot:gb/GEZJ01007405.1/.p1 GENE.gb/GEZJ01007405.1/~~gb/GEZJ01007405.1/.p1  ORF type:complete len:109 (-),score=11.53 gb/GEZJ01007405.1/:284-610(-)